MRLLADKNISGGAVDALRAAGHDVIWLRTAAPGMPDNDGGAWAARDERIILTFDKDFGELAVRHRLPDKSGVVLFRLPMTAVRSIGQKIAGVWKSATIGLAILVSWKRAAFACVP